VPSWIELKRHRAAAYGSLATTNLESTLGQ
jgi:hypothetical protein